MENWISTSDVQTRNPFFHTACVKIDVRKILLTNSKRDSRASEAYGRFTFWLHFWLQPHDNREEWLLLTRLMVTISSYCWCLCPFFFFPWGVLTAAAAAACFGGAVFAAPFCADGFTGVFGPPLMTKMKNLITHHQRLLTILGSVSNVMECRWIQICNMKKLPVWSLQPTLELKPNVS